MILYLPLRVTVGAYGDEIFARPRVQQSRSAGSSRRQCVTIVDGSDLVVENLHLAGCSVGIQLLHTTNSSRSNVLISKNFFADINQPFADYRPESGAWGSAVEFASIGDRAVLTNVTISNNVAIRVDAFFSSTLYTDGLLLSANTVTMCSMNCVGMVVGKS